METVPVSLRALMQRINRKLAHEGEVLKTARGGFNTDLGNYYIVDVDRNFLVAGNCDPEQLGREMGVLAKWESLADT